MPRNNGATFDGDSNRSITDDLVDTCNEITCRVFVSQIVDFSRNWILPFVERDCVLSPAFLVVKFFCQVREKIHHSRAKQEFVWEGGKKCMWVPVYDWQKNEEFVCQNTVSCY